MLSERVAIESPHPSLRPWRTRTSMRGLGRDLISATSDLNRGPPGRDAGDSREPYPVARFGTDHRDTFTVCDHGLPFAVINSASAGD